MSTSESELGTDISTKLGILDGSDVIVEIIFDIRVSLGVKGEILGFGTGVITITGVIGVSDGSSDLSLSLFNVEVVLGNLSSSGLGDWDGEGEVFVSESSLGDSDGVGGWDLSGSGSLDLFLNSDLSGSSLDDLINDGLFNNLYDVLNNFVVDGLLDFNDFDFGDLSISGSWDLIDDDLADGVVDDFFDFFNDLSWDLLVDDGLNILEDDSVDLVSDNLGDGVNNSLSNLLGDGLGLKGGDLSLDGIDDSSSLLGNDGLWDEINS